MRPLAFWPGPLLALAITLPWLIAIGMATEGRFYADLLLREIGPKLVSGGDHKHGGIPGYYLLWLPIADFSSDLRVTRRGALELERDPRTAR